MDVSVSGKVNESGTNIFRCYLEIDISLGLISKIVNLKRARWTSGQYQSYWKGSKLIYIDIKYFKSQFKKNLAYTCDGLIGDR